MDFVRPLERQVLSQELLSSIASFRVDVLLFCVQTAAKEPSPATFGTCDIRIGTEGRELLERFPKTGLVLLVPSFSIRAVVLLLEIAPFSPSSEP